MTQSNPLIPSKFLVTGSSGFIGTSLVNRLLNYGHIVYGLDIKCSKLSSPRYFHIHSDLLETSSTELFEITGNVDYVIHLAARTDLDGSRLLDYNVNLLGVRVICDYAKIHDSVSLLFASTQLVNRLGDVSRSPLDYSPDSCYGLSKVLGEIIVCFM